MGITGVGVNYGAQSNIGQKTGTGREGKISEKEELTREEMFQMISNRIEEVYEKVKNNDTEPSFQIGSQSFTIKEWDRMLKQFDAAQEKIREQMREEQAKRQKEITTKVSVKTETSVTSKDSTDIAKAAGIVGLGGKVAANGVEMEEDSSVMESLVAESTICTYPSADENEPDKKYITWYTSEGIFCREAGQTEGYYWTIPFQDASQYDKVIGFLGRIKLDADYRFAANKDFWQDFLKGEIDEEDILKGINGVENGMTADIGENSYE